VCPLFDTEVRFKKEYYLITNKNRNLIILNVKEEERPNTFGKDTNGYPWRITWWEKKVCLEWLHGVSDGLGALHFLKQIILAYFERDLKEKSTNFIVAPGLEPFYDKDEKGNNFHVEPDGYKIKYLPPIKRMYKTDIHELICDTKEIVDLAKYCKSSVAPVIALLYSMAIRKHIPKKAKNKNVACNVVIDLRRMLKYETMHNCVEYKRITYTDEYLNMNFKTVAQRYKEILDQGREPRNVVRAVTERIQLFKLYHFIHRRWWLKFCTKAIGKILKHSDCNFVVTYLGKIDFGKGNEDIIDKIELIDCKVWHDFAECILSAIDCNGVFHVNVSENFQEKGIVEDFIKLAKENGVHFKEINCSLFTQSHFVEK